MGNFENHHLITSDHVVESFSNMWLVVSAAGVSTRCLRTACRSISLGGAYNTAAMSNDALVDGLKANGVLTSSRVESVMRKVDRGFFCKGKWEAYIDTPLSIGQGQTISAPHMHCYALEELESVIHENSHVLDVGSGSGYLTTCFGGMVGKGGKVVGLERISSMVEFARENIMKVYPNLIKEGIIELVEGDGWKGHSPYAPYDAIHVGAAAESIPEELIAQLKNGGRMIIPVGKSLQQLIRVDKDRNGKISKTKLLDVIYVPLVKE